MANLKIMVVKRGGAIEPFALGRVALAVFRAAQGSVVKLGASESRKLGEAVSQAVLETLVNQGAGRVAVEAIQDSVVSLLAALGHENLARVYQDYREAHRQEREHLGQTRVAEKGFKFAKKDSAPVEFEREDWAKALSLALNRGAKNEWSVGSWWSACKDLAIESKTFDDFVSVHIRALLEASSEREPWLESASALLLERWYVRLCGVGPMLHGEMAANKALRAHFKAYWVARKIEQKPKWFPLGKELDALSKVLDQKKDAALKFYGLTMMEQVFGWGKDALLPQEVLANSAIALCYAGKLGELAPEGRIRPCVKLFEWFAQARLIPPLSLMRQSRIADPCLTQETHLAMDDSLEGIFNVLAKMTLSAKSGSSVSVDLSALRADGAPVGDGGQTSGGLSPVLRLFGEACSMLKGRDGERQKARLSVACWHRDLEVFLAYCKTAPKEMRLSLYLPDAFMRGVFEGGGWVLASPSEAPHLLGSKVEDFDRWIREYAQMAKFSGLGLARSVPARDIFEWICLCIAGSGGPSIVFQNACLHYGQPLAAMCLSARMSMLFDPSKKEARALELGLNLDGLSVNEASEIFVEAHGLLSKIGVGDGLSTQAVLAPVGRVSRRDFAEMLGNVSKKMAELGGRRLDKGALWRDSNPWETRLKILEASRGGYIEHEDDGFDAPKLCGRDNGPESLVSLSSREEYLWLGGTNPVYVNHDQYRRQVWFEGLRLGFGGSGGYESIKKQAKRAASWQKWSDGALAWDARLDHMDSNAIGEAIKIAWLNGLTGVRRFVGKRT